MKCIVFALLLPFLGWSETRKFSLQLGEGKAIDLELPASFTQDAPNNSWLGVRESSLVTFWATSEATLEVRSVRSPKRCGSELLKEQHAVFDITLSGAFRGKRQGVPEIEEGAEDRLEMARYSLPNRSDSVWMLIRTLCTPNRIVLMQALSFSDDPKKREVLRSILQSVRVRNE